MQRRLWFCALKLSLEGQCSKKTSQWFLGTSIFSAQIEIFQKNWEHKLYNEGTLGNALQYHYDDWCPWNLVH